MSFEYPCTHPGCEAPGLHGVAATDSDGRPCYVQVCGAHVEARP